MELIPSAKDEQMSRSNCWEVMECGRQPGGVDTGLTGVCPVPTETRLNACNHGDNAGRACWYVVGTKCRGKVQGVFAHKFGDCMQCEFYRIVSREEGPDFAKAKDVLVLLRKRELAR